MYQTRQYITTQPQEVKEQMLHWSAQYTTVAYYDSNFYPSDRYACFECMLAVGNDAPALQFYNNVLRHSFAELQAFHRQCGGWLFGFLGYDLKNELENLQSEHFDGVLMPDMYFFCPDVVITLPPNSFSVTIYVRQDAGINPDMVWEQLNKQSATGTENAAFAPVHLQPRVSKEIYTQKVHALQEHIKKGDLYEVNLCQEWYAQGQPINPYRVFNRLNTLAQAPFSAFVRVQDRYLLCASPERFLQKKGNLLISQPIKGTIKRNHSDALADRQLKEQLYLNPKERAENVMIVDLVRNDLTRSAILGTIQVPELFGVYTFKNVHHLISTVSARMQPYLHWTTALEHAFPMGSMTGAPKIMAMQLIERYELTRRGLYSGAVGYITPDGNFDFNVVIRSLLYNAANVYLSLQVGGAITYLSDAQSEYEECLLKAQTAMQALQEG